MFEITDRDAIISRLRELGVRPRKHLGQNFLVDRGSLARIVSEVRKAKPGIIVEIGPGLGIVTEELAKLKTRLIGVEIDHRLASFLQRNLSAYDNVEILEQDFLKLDLSSLAEGPYYIVGNLPYRITSPILAKLIEDRNQISQALLLTQAEVAEKIINSPGVHGSALGVLINAYTAVEIIRDVPRTSFYPVPKVDSVLWRMEFLDHPRFTANEQTFFTVVRAIYGKRRKMLRRVLRDILPPDKIEGILTHAGIDPTRRGETLSISELDRLTHAIFG